MILCPRLAIAGRGISAGLRGAFLSSHSIPFTFEVVSLTG